MQISLPNFAFFKPKISKLDSKIDFSVKCFQKKKKSKHPSPNTHESSLVNLKVILHWMIESKWTVDKVTIPTLLTGLHCRTSMIFGMSGKIIVFKLILKHRTIVYVTETSSKMAATLSQKWLTIFSCFLPKSSKLFIFRTVWLSSNFCKNIAISNLCFHKYRNL